MNHRLRHITIVAAVLSAMLSSCIYNNDQDCIGRQNGEGSVVLSLTITSQGTFRTRAINHDSEAALDAEDYIDPDDYQIMIFDGRGRFVQNFYATERRISAAGSDSRKYSIALSGPLSVSTGEIQVLVLTNQNSFDSSSSYPALTTGDLLTNLYTNDMQNLFVLPTTPSIESGTAVSWKPEIDKCGIPMFGISATVPLSAATNPTDNDTINGVKVDGKVLDMGEIMLLRAVAKIEVVRDAAYADDGISISAASVSAYNTIGRFIPDITANPNWDVTNIQVATPTLPVDVKRNDSGLIFFSDNDKFYAYVPEMDLRTDRPTLTICAQQSGNTQSFDIALDNPNLPGSLDYLLRNHIYRYTVANIEMNADIEIVLDVVPYDNTVLNPGVGNENDAADVDGKPYDDTELNPDTGNDHDEADVDGKPYDDTELNTDTGNNHDEAEVDGKPYDDTELNPDTGNDRDEAEVDGKPYDDTELNPDIGNCHDEAEVDGTPYDDTTLNPSFGKESDERDEADTSFL